MEQEKFRVDIDFQKSLVIITQKGTVMKIPDDISCEKYYDSMQAVLALLKERGLTIKQAQEVCVGAAELILETDFN